MPRIRLRDGQSLHVRILGRGQPCVVLHGFGMHSAHWIPFLWPLRQEFRFILPDLRGFGHSAGVRHNSDCVLTNYAEDLADVVQALRLDHFYLAGISMGAFTALQYLRLFGSERVLAYLNIDQSPFVRHTEDWTWGLFGDAGRHKLQRLARLHEDARQFSPDTRYEQLPEAFRAAFHDELGDFIAYALAQPRQKAWVRHLCRIPGIADTLLPGHHWQAYLRCLGAYLSQDYDMRPVARGLDIPVHVLAGIRSSMYPWQGQKVLADEAPRGRFIPFWNSGHLPMLDEPLRFAATLREVFA